MITFRLPIVILVIFFIAGGFTAWSVGSNAKSIRQLPDRGSFTAAITAPEPLGFTYRFLLLRPGSDRYYAAIYPWLFHPSAEISDNALNRSLLEDFVLGAPYELTLTNISDYPIAASNRLAPILTKVIYRTRSKANAPVASDERYWSRQQLIEQTEDALELLDDFPEGQQIVSEWIREEILDPQDVKMMKTFFNTLANIEGIDLVTLLDAFKKELAGASGWIGSRWDAPHHPKLFFYRRASQSAINLTESPHLIDLVDWATQELARDHLDISQIGWVFSAALCSKTARDPAIRWLNSASDGSQLGILEEIFFSRDAVDPDSATDYAIAEAKISYSIPECTPEEIIQEALKLSLDHPRKHLAIVHELIHLDHDLAKSLASDYLESEDSALRKGTIVLLVRHGATPARYDIDDAFRGEAPRILLFRDDYQYRGSNAYQDYEQLSGHEYGHIGKRFPPFLNGQLPTENEISEWRNFVRSYPWFPATDDAYYRLAYALFLRSDLAGASSVIKEFESMDFIDTDIAPYMARLDKLLSLLTHPRSLNISKSQLSALTRANWLRDKESVEQKIENAILAVDVLIANRKTANAMNISKGGLRSARRELDLARVACRKYRSPDCELPQSYIAVKRRIQRYYARGRSDRLSVFVWRIAS